MAWPESERFIESLVQSVGRAAALDDGLAHSSFFLEYQPVANVVGHIGGCEALLRYRYDGEVMPPALFIPILQRMGIFSGLARPIIEQSIRDALRIREWIPDMIVSINLSGDQLRDQQLVNAFSRRLQRASLPPEHFGIEISEEELIIEGSGEYQQVVLFQAAGHPILIDDFGIGYSNVSRLVQIESAVVKLDRSFLRSLNSHTDRTMIAIRKAIELTHALGARVTCEGVETREQLYALAGAGADFFQGYYVARPAQLENFIDLIRPQIRHKRMMQFRRLLNRAS